ncbi:MAG: Leucine-rich repeat (LRR) protein [Arcticibacterium sp.]|jgi:Leucine-rich repeat (LRR) protein
MLKNSLFLSMLFMFQFQISEAQYAVDSTLLKKEFFDLDEALEQPELVFRLNLSNQAIQLPDDIWTKFPNLLYLSLKNDHLKEIPKGIGDLKKLEILDLSGNDFRSLPSTFSNLTSLQELYLENDHLKAIPKGIGNLKKLKILDLSGNDFRTLPSSFSNLTNLQELYLNDDKYFQLEKSIPILSQLPKLTSLHLENDNLKKLPSSILKLNYLESLYLNNNQFKQLPEELNGLKNLKYVDFQKNYMRIPNQDTQSENIGLKIVF